MWEQGSQVPGPLPHTDKFRNHKKKGRPIECTNAAEWWQYNEELELLPKQAVSDEAWSSNAARGP